MTSRACIVRQRGQGRGSNLVKREKDRAQRRAWDHLKGKAEKGELVAQQEKLQKGWMLA